MGMDLYSFHARTKRAKKGLSLNWTAWHYLLTLLDELDCDISEASMFNEGERISAPTCRVWAQALRAYIRGLGFAKTGRSRSVANTPARGLSGKNRAVNAFYLRQGIISRSDKGFSQFRTDQKLLIRIAYFFENCGGCRQY
jgi:hypothetical protein